MYIKDQSDILTFYPLVYYPLVYIRYNCFVENSSL